MTDDRNKKILRAGKKAALERMACGWRRKPEYPRNFMKLYNTMGNSFCDLFDAIQRDNPLEVREEAANIIVKASEMIEYAEFVQRVGHKPWDTME